MIDRMCALSKTWYLVLLVLVFITKPILIGAPYIEFPDPVVWYTFNEISGDTAYDYSGNGFHAILQGSTLSRDPGKSVTLRQSDGIDVPNVQELSGYGDFTIAFDLSIGDLSLHDTMIFFMNVISVGNSNYKMGYNSYDNFFAVYYDWDSINRIDYTITDEFFHEIVLVYKDTLVSLYFDTELIADSIIVEPRFDVVAYSWMGEDFNGSFNEFKYFNQALGSKQVELVFEPDSVEPTTPNNLIARVVGEQKVSLDWSSSFDSYDVSGYLIYRNNELIDWSDTNYYLDTDLIANASYTYKVRAYDYTGNFSEYSNIVSIDICSDIQVEHDNFEYFVCTDDTITLHTHTTNFDYTFKWQFQYTSGWEDITDNEIISNSDSMELVLSGITGRTYLGNYRLSINNLCGAYYSDPIHIDMHDLYSLWGSVMANNQPVNTGMVYLFNYDTSWPVVIDSIELFMGHYHFTNICPGNYLIKAQPSGSTSEVYAHRFFSDGYNFNTAESIDVYSDVGNVNIYLKPKVLQNNLVEKDFFITMDKNRLNISNKLELYTEAQISLINTLGDKVYTRKIELGQKNIQIDISGYMAGLYVLNISNYNTNITKKLIIY